MGIYQCKQKCIITLKKERFRGKKPLDTDSIPQGKKTVKDRDLIYVLKDTGSKYKTWCIRKSYYPHY